MTKPEILWVEISRRRSSHDENNQRTGRLAKRSRQVSNWRPSACGKVSGAESLQLKGRTRSVPYIAYREERALLELPVQQQELRSGVLRVPWNGHTTRVPFTLPSRHCPHRWICLHFFYLLTNANGDPEFAYQTTSKWIFNLFICVAGAALCRASSYVVQMISDCREWYSGPPPPTSREAHNTLVVAHFPINSCEPCETDVSAAIPRDRPGPPSGCCGARKYSCPNCRGARCTTCHWPTDVSPDLPRCMCLNSEPEIAAEAAPVASPRQWADVKKEEDDTSDALPIEWPDQCRIRDRLSRTAPSPGPSG